MGDKADSDGVHALQDQLASVSLAEDGGESRQASACESSSTPVEGERGECAICLQQCSLPLCLPCGHTFCYLCAKGIAFRSRRCALCRRPIPDEVISRPQIDSKQVEPVSLPRVAAESTAPAEHPEAAGDKVAEDVGVWYYEGHNGWWQYEPRTNRVIENAYLAEEQSCEVLIAGYMYSIDLENMSQARLSHNTRRRRICRNLSPDAVRKGVAGVPFSSSSSSSAAVTSEAEHGET